MMLNIKMAFFTSRCRSNWRSGCRMTGVPTTGKWSPSGRAVVPSMDGNKHLAKTEQVQTLFWGAQAWTKSRIAIDDLKVFLWT